ncbi:MAG: toast rack family protein [Anaerolineales bacterium]|jgi:hypothetical protein
MSSTNLPQNQASAMPIRRKNTFLRWVQIISWLVTLGFLLALAWAVYQSLANGATFPLWAWLGAITILAVAIGLIVMAVVYQGVKTNTAPFDFEAAGQVSGKLVSESKRVEAEGAETLRTEIEMLQGLLQVTPGGEAALDGSFAYDDADWQPPHVAYARDAEGVGQLRVKQQGTSRPAMRQGPSDWKLALGREIPTDLYIHQGAGKAELHLGGLNLTHLRVDSGVGELILDLRGPWQRSLEISLKTGIGDATLYLPQEVGVRIQEYVGLGSASPKKLTWNGEAYVNAVFGNSPVTLDIVVNTGMGKLSIA